MRLALPPRGIFYYFIYFIIFYIFTVLKYIKLQYFSGHAAVVNTCYLNGVC